MTRPAATTGSGTHPRTLAPRRTRDVLLAAGIPVSLALLALGAALSVAVGTKAIPLTDVWSSLMSSGEHYNDLVIQARIPRTVLGILVGAALAVAGAVMQGITRNPLGDPGLLGINAGASAGVVTGTALLGVGVGTSVWIALPGALIAAVLVFALGSNRGRGTPVRLVLAGAVISAVLAAYTQGMTLSFPSIFESYRFWVIGSLSAATWATIGSVIWFILPTLVIAFLLARGLNALGLGDEASLSLGANPVVIRSVGLGAVALLAAAATAAAGPIGFVGLAVPHLVRGVTGSDFRWLLPYSAIMGAALLLGADVLARIVLRPGELMVGIVTAFLGAPFLIIAVRRMKSRS